jgi:hypothetical protein
LPACFTDVFIAFEGDDVWLELGVSVCCGAEAAEGFDGLLGRVAGYTVEETSLVEMGSEQGGFPCGDGFLQEITETLVNICPLTV